MDPGAARDRVKRISGCRCIGAHALVTLFKYLFCPPTIYQRSVSLVSILIYGSSLRFSTSASRHPSFSTWRFRNFSLLPTPRKSPTVSRKTCSKQRISLFLFGEQSAYHRFERAATRDDKAAIFRADIAGYGEQIREIKFVCVERRCVAIFITFWKVVSTFSGQFMKFWKISLLRKYQRNFRSIKIYIYPSYLSNPRLFSSSFQKAKCIIILLWLLFFQICTVLASKMRVDQIGLLLWKNYVVRKRQPVIYVARWIRLVGNYQSNESKKTRERWMFRAYWLWYSYGRWQCSWSSTRFATTWIRNTIQLANFLRGRCRRTGCSRSFRASSAALETPAIPYRNTKKFLLTRTPR